ncbi:hypothetical protein H4219_003208 [Mycoemilia scoparia]|uniref:Uncharacterized protein n=1 Tax=Mycoemilia scoparia TaxID=417184 RepID=A0A9W8A1Z6_9FUNG|nr:hypothetical protein H4219_003208 [Mycoemilia scoparia]
MLRFAPRKTIFYSRNTPLQAASRIQSTRLVLNRTFFVSATTNSNNDTGISGTVKAYQRHIIVCSTRPEHWPSKAEGTSELTMKLAALARTLHGTTVTLSDINLDAFSQQPHRQSKPDSSKADTLDVVVYPGGDYVTNLGINDIDTLVDHFRKQDEKAGIIARPSRSPQHQQSKTREGRPLDWNTIPEDHTLMLVCTHGSRDSRCGEFGGKLLELLREKIEKDKLANSVTAWCTSHIGGHKYAANVIVYPEGDWYGNLAPESQTVTKLLSYLKGKDVWWDKWRGRLNCTKVEQKDMYETLCQCARPDGCKDTK